MSKRKFSVGEFVCAVNYEEKWFFYIYDYIADTNYPYCLVSLDGRFYTAIAKHLKPIDSLNGFLNRALLSLSNRKVSLLVYVKKLQADSSVRSYPLSWSLDLRVRHD